MADHSLPILCGVDVALATLEIAQTGQRVTRIPNTVSGITDWLASLPGHARIGIEATGRYHELLHSLAKASGHEVFLINGRQLNHYREAVGQRAKTDADDARLLLRYLTHEQGDLMPAPVLNSQEKRLWALLQRRALLVKTRSQLKLSLRGDPQTEAIGQDLAAQLNQAIAKIERCMTTLAQELGWQASIRLCQTIPGVGVLSAIALTACFHRGEFKRADQWVAYMGLDVRVRDSGTCRGRRKLSKRGNPEIRRLLFNGAMSAAKMPSIRPRYEQYRARGMSSTEALVAMSRKLARIAFAVLSKGEAYDAKMPGWACACP
jgi:transposase